MNELAWLSRRACTALTVAALLLLNAVVAATQGVASSSTVSLTIDYGDGSLKVFTDLPWSKGATVLHVMNAAKLHARGITFQFRGSGNSAFVTEIDGLKSEGGGAQMRGWKLSVNGNDPKRSPGSYELSPLDVIHWRFETEQRNQQSQGR